VRPDERERSRDALQRMEPRNNEESGRERTGGAEEERIRRGESPVEMKRERTPRNPAPNSC